MARAFRSACGYEIPFIRPYLDLDSRLCSSYWLGGRWLPAPPWFWGPTRHLAAACSPLWDFVHEMASQLSLTFGNLTVVCSIVVHPSLKATECTIIVSEP